MAFAAAGGASSRANNSQAELSKMEALLQDALANKILAEGKCQDEHEVTTNQASTPYPLLCRLTSHPYKTPKGEYVERKARGGAGVQGAACSTPASQVAGDGVKTP